MTQVIVNNSSYSDDGSTPRDMRGGGHRIHLLPMIGDTMVEVGKATAAATAAGTAKGAAETARDGAQAAKAAADADAAATAADRLAVAADKATTLAARDQALAAQGAADADAVATAADRAAVAADQAAVATDKGTVAADKAIVAADKATVQTALASTITARDAAAGSAGAAAADRVQTGADRSATGTALATAQALVGSAGTGTATGLAYAALIKSLANAADVVAVFVYNRLLDGDGGNWGDRKSASWYWETLNTATRGARRPFPAVALIVAWPTYLTIYDAHDLDAGGVPRMWMVVSGGVLGAGTPIATIFAMNGRVLWGHTTGLFYIDFISDEIYAVNSGGYYRWGRVSSRSGGSYATISLSIAPIKGLVSDNVRGIHARVLPGAPLDSAGLPIPTVAVATAGGVSVIHPWGAVYDITRAAGNASVHLGFDGLLYAQHFDANPLEYGPIPYADITNSAWRRRVFASTTFPSLPVSPNSIRVTAIAGDNAAVGSSTAGHVTLAIDRSNPDASMVSYTAINYATGWQPGDIRGAWLCDTTTGNITGSGELVTNGDFSSGTTGWTTVNATLTTSSGQLVVSRSASGNAVADTAIAVTPGQTYVVRAEASKGTTTGALSLHISDGSTGGPVLLNLSSFAASAVFLGQFTAVSATAVVRLFHGGTVVGETALFDNVSARLALPDRSYRGRGMVVNGTVSRTALACGLAAVSATWSATNRLSLPPHPDFDWTGDFWVRVWVNMPAGNGRLIGRTTDATGTVTQWRLNAGVDVGCEFVTPTGNLVGMPNIPSNTWTCIDGCRRGTSIEMWHNGAMVGSLTGVAADLTAPNAVMYIGSQANGTGASPAGTQIALARVAAYAPTPAQIRRMWEDERALIIGGTAATLGGVSNNVTALAANDSNGTLAVGTSDGVSVFAGLGRVQYLDGTSGGTGIGNDAITALSASGPHLLIGTSANAGLISDSVIARDRLLPAGPPVPRAAGDPQVITLRGITTDATPTDLNPRLFVGEREAVTLDVTVQARTYGAASTQGGTYRRLARYIRDAGGNITLAGSVQTIGTDQETTAGMDVTLSIDTSAQTVTPRVTGVAGTRMVWTSRIVVTRISEDLTYAA